KLETRPEDRADGVTFRSRSEATRQPEAGNHPDPAPTTLSPVIARSGREGRIRQSVAGCRHAAGPEGRALRKRRGNPEDLPPKPPPCHSAFVSFRAKRRIPTTMRGAPFLGILRCAQNDT